MSWSHYRPHPALDRDDCLLLAGAPELDLPDSADSYDLGETRSTVRVATWTPEKHLGSYPVGETIEITWGKVWVALESEERPRCAGFPRRRLNHRLEQLLGLPPGGPPRRFVVLEVARADLHRPCFDPDPTSEPCPLEAAPGLPEDFLDWLGVNALASYRLPNGFP